MFERFTDDARQVVVLAQDEARQLNHTSIGTEHLSERPPQFTPRVKRLIELARDEADALGHTSIATEHLLLGLVSGNGGVGARVLHDHGTDPETIRAAVARM